MNDTSQQNFNNQLVNSVQIFKTLIYLFDFHFWIHPVSKYDIKANSAIGLHFSGAFQRYIKQTIPPPPPAPQKTPYPEHSDLHRIIALSHVHWTI